MSGRPIRFLGATLVGWTVFRVVALWPGVDPLPALIRAAAPPVVAEVLPAGAHLELSSRVAPGPAGRRTASAIMINRPDPAIPPASAAPATVLLARSDQVEVQQQAAPLQPPPLRPTPLADPSSRWALSVWAIARDGRSGALPNGQLGGSQTGARATYLLDRRRRVALAARASTPLEGRGREAAIGIDWQPTSAPVHLVVEQRVSLDGGRSRPAAYLIGGLDPLPVGRGFCLEAYGQAGAVQHIGAFADGAARLARPVAKIGGVRIDLGIGSWGGAQRGAARLDIGPSAAAILPVAGRSVRVTLDWRQRIAGDAAPGSGPALAIGGDF